MIKQLRKRLTIIFTTITSLILLAVLGFTFWYNINQLRAGFIRDFNSNVSYIGLSLSNSIDNTSWLTELEEKNQMIISAKKDGEDISFSPGWDETGRNTALDKALDVLSEQTVIQTASYTSPASAFSGYPSERAKAYSIDIADDTDESEDVTTITYIIEEGEVQDFTVVSYDKDGNVITPSLIPTELFDKLTEQILEENGSSGKVSITLDADGNLEETIEESATENTENGIEGAEDADEGQPTTAAVEPDSNEDSLTSEDDEAYSIIIAKALPANSATMGNAQDFLYQYGSEDTEDIYIPNDFFTTAYDSHIDFSTNDNHKYRMQSMTYIGTDTVYDLVLLDDRAKETKAIIFTCAIFAGLFLLGVIVLAIVNWLLSKLIVKPTEDGLRKQAEFVAAASHELRNPLAVIKGSIEASKITDNEEEKQKYYDNVDAEANRMNRLVNDLLLLAGSDSKRWSLIMEPFDVDTMLIEMSEQYAPIAKKSDMILSLDLPDEALGEIVGDSIRIRQILSVFIDNAISHSSSGEEILLSAKKKKKKLYLSVIDHGNGIKNEDKERIFDRFFRADDSRNNKKHFGLGLSIAKELAKLHSGSIEITDTDGGGSTFTLILPEKSKDKHSQ